MILYMKCHQPMSRLVTHTVNKSVHCRRDHACILLVWLPVLIQLCARHQVTIPVSKWTCCLHVSKPLLLLMLWLTVFHRSFQSLSTMNLMTWCIIWSAVDCSRSTTLMRGGDCVRHWRFFFSSSRPSIYLCTHLVVNLYRHFHFTCWNSIQSWSEMTSLFILLMGK